MKNMRLHDDAIAFLRNVRLMDGKIEDRDMGAIPLPKDAPQRAEILIKPMAYVKMIALIQSFSTEIGWHGICKRSAEKDNVFTIEDVFVYPQIVTGSNITTDEAAQDMATLSPSLMMDGFGKTTSLTFARLAFVQSTG